MEQQMINQEAPVAEKISWKEFTAGFFRKNGDGKIFYGGPWYGGENFTTLFLKTARFAGILLAS